MENRYYSNRRPSVHAAARIRKNVFDSETRVLPQHPDFLMHYGITGQKWGIRRFQNEDRSYTEAGKQRYAKKSEDKELKRAERQLKKEEKKAAKEAAKPESSRWKSDEAGFLSDEELNRRNSRLQREQQYKQLTETKVKKFMKGVGKAANKILVGSLIGAAAGFAGKNYKTMIETGSNFIGKHEWMQIDLSNLRPGKV